MAQVLKEDYRNRILSAAKKELLLKGVRDASMRNIAFHSSMTVGNLYRYFKGKDELIQFIVSPALERLNDVIQKKTQDRLSLFQKTSGLGLSKNEMTRILDSLADDLTLIYHEYRDEMKILFLDSAIQMQISDWFTQLIETVIYDEFAETRTLEKKVQLFSRMLAVSIFSGLQECFRLLEMHEFSNQDVGQLIRLYFRLYLSMLDYDLNKLSMEE